MQDTRGLSGEAQQALRERAMAAIDRGHAPALVADILGVTPNTIYIWTSKRRAGGDAALRSRQRGCPVGSGRLLTAEQEADLKQLVGSTTPAANGIASATWTRAAVVELARRRHGATVSVRGMGEYLKRWQCTCKRAERHDPLADPAAVERWVTTEYPAIQAKAKAEDAAILFLDETGVSSNPTPARGYAPVGQTPTVEMPNQRRRTNVTAAVGPAGELLAEVRDANTTGETFVKTMTRLLSKVRRKVHLILDRHPAHTCAVAQAWLKANAKRVEAHFLPAHAPDLNAVEYLNQDLKANVFKEGYPRSLPELRGKVMACLDRLGKIPNVGARYFGHEDVAYARAR